MSKFPAVKEVICTSLDPVQKRNKHTAAQVAEKIGVEPATVASWRSGAKKPKDDNLRGLAQYIWPDSEPDQDTFVQSVQDAESASTGSGILADIRYNARPLQTAQADPKILTAFPKKVLDRLLLFAGIRPNNESGNQAQAKDLTQMLVSGKLDVGIGLCSTIDRLFLLRFIATPLRIGMNGVVLRRHLDETPTMFSSRESIRGALAIEATPNETLRPIVRTYDIGGAFIQKTLQFPESLCTPVPGLTPAIEFAEALTKDDGKQDRLPFAFTDEVSCLEILRHLESIGAPGELLYPLTTADSVRDTKRDLPLYVIGFAFKKSTTSELADVIQDGLASFLQTEIETVSDWYHSTRVALEDLASRHLPIEKDEDPKQLAREWVTYAFRLSDELIATYEESKLPWRAMLQRSQQKMEHDVRRRLRKIVSDIMLADLSQISGHTRNLILQRVREEMRIEVTGEEADFKTWAELEYTIRREWLLATPKRPQPAEAPALSSDRKDTLQ